MDIVVAEFELYFDFEKQSQLPQRVFKTIADLLVVLGKLDSLLAQTAAPELRAELVLEDIETGSIRAKLAVFLRGIPEEAVKSFDWRKVIGHFLNKGLQRFIKFLEDKPGLYSADELKNLQTALEGDAAAASINPLLVPGQIPLDKLVVFIEELTRAVSSLREKEYIEYRSSAGNARFNPHFNTANLQALLVTETQNSESEYLVKAKRPDFMGESMWELVLKGHTITAKMADTGWLEDFHEGRVDFRPSDYLRIKLHTETTFRGSFGNPSAHYTVLKVLGVVRQ
ncbi:hypothetical protein [Hymenobacter sp. PAMC 26628]|uniref:hypothetical protein n=1 Tax=Hymenobacter sp. PAMC 26628 TaxID=1484118 RepID=UPI00076FE1F9|nr:hypothetical protein [Hymenobacter sp. PAMC 26628]AMJ65737.1 hypothetical protein AXW84_10080 [Hymenobacter sp. PAMC 26628]